MDVKHILDAQFLYEAKTRNIHTMGMVRSWDYLTAKGIVRANPDKMLVHNEIIKNEAVRLVDMRPEDVIVVGIPHYDLFTNEDRSSREALFKKIGLSSDKQVLFFGSVGRKFGATDNQIFDILDKAIHSGVLPKNLAVFVRLPPFDALSKEAQYCQEHFVFEYPGVSFEGHGRKENEMSKEDLRHLADLIYYSEVVVTGPSTVCIDAAALDKPIVCLGFEGYDKRPYFESIIHRYDFDHMQLFVRTGAGIITHNEKEFLSLINHAIQYPEDRRQERAQFTKEQCGILDGQASRRLAEAVLAEL